MAEQTKTGDEMSEQAKQEVTHTGDEVVMSGAQYGGGGALTLIQSAIESKSSIEVVERLYAMHKDDQDRTARRSFFESLAEFQSKCPPILNVDKAHNNDYAKLPRIVGAIKVPLAESGLSFRFEMDTKTDVSVTCVLTHKDGHSVETAMSAGPDKSGSKNEIQAIAATVTYLRRYTLLGALGIVTADPDTDGGKPLDVIDEAQLGDLLDMLTNCPDGTVEKLNDVYGITDIASLLMTDYESAKKRLTATAKKAGG